MAAIVAALEPFALAAVHELTTLSGSVLIALAVLAGWLDEAAAWKVAHVDEDWQISQWGEDSEAVLRRRARWRDFAAAVALLKAIAPNSRA